MQKLKVLWFTNTPSLLTPEITGGQIFEGSWISSLELLIREKTSEIELHIAFFGNCNRIEMVELGNVTYYKIPRPGKIERWLRRFLLIQHTSRDIKNILEVVDTVKPGLIHVFGTESVFGMISDKVGIPVLIQIQGIVNSFIPVYFGNLSFFQVVESAGIRDFLYAGVLFRYLNEKKRAKRELKILKKPKYLLGRTGFDESFLFQINPDIKYFHLDDVIRREFFTERSPKQRSARPVFLTVIHAEFYKGLDLIFQVCDELQRAGIDFEWRIAGLGESDSMVKVIRKATRFTDSNNNISFLGKIGADHLVEAMTNCDIYIHTSFIENSSIAICEAMCLGLPVIAANVGGTPSLIENGVSGVLFSAGNPEELISAVKKIMEDPDFAGFLGENARKSALVRHNPESIYHELERIYSEVTGFNFSSSE